jgi:hypothetical protein
VNARSTLATRVTFTHPKGVVDRRDAIVLVTPGPRGYVTLETLASDTHVAIRLSEAERIALIEALGGRA